MADGNDGRRICNVVEMHINVVKPSSIQKNVDSIKDKSENVDGGVEENNSYGDGRGSKEEMTADRNDG